MASADFFSAGALRAASFADLCGRAVRLLSSEPTLLRVPGACVFCGDLHGSLADLRSVVAAWGSSEDFSLVFLGDLVDRGPDSLEVLEEVLALKLAFPSRVFLLRGNHETASMTQAYGFTNELTDKLGFESAFRVFGCCKQLFAALPLAAVCGGRVLHPTHSQAHDNQGCRVFACHGGISAGLSLEEIASCDRFSVVDSGDSSVADVLLWSDPRPEDGPSDRGVGVHFGESSLRAFLSAAGCACLVRGHELADGLEFPFGDQSCVTVFSSSNYLGCGNQGACLWVDPDGCFGRTDFFNGPPQGSPGDLGRNELGSLQGAPPQDEPQGPTEQPAEGNELES